MLTVAPSLPAWAIHEGGRSRYAGGMLRRGIAPGGPISTGNCSSLCLLMEATMP